MLGMLSSRSPLLHMLCERWHKAKNAVENPLQNTTSKIWSAKEHLKVRDFATCEGPYLELHPGSRRSR